MKEKDWQKFIEDVVLSNKGSKLILFNSLDSDSRQEIARFTCLLPDELPVGIYYVDLNTFLLFTDQRIISH